MKLWELKLYWMDFAFEMTVSLWGELVFGYGLNVMCFSVKLRSMVMMVNSLY